HSLRKSRFGAGQNHCSEHSPGVHEMMSRGVRNGTPGVGIVHGGLSEEIRTAGDISRMEKAVVFEREVRMNICGADPILDGTAADEGCVLQVLRRRKS